jgi:hypothetical protein
MPEHESPLDAGAVYAGMVRVRDYAESDEGKAEYRHLMEKMRAMAAEIAPGGKFYPKPKVEFRGFRYPGDRTSFEFGLELGRQIVFGPPGVAKSFAKWEGASGEAVRRFLADRAH